MAIGNESIKLMVCPQCKGKLVLNEKGKSIECEKCKLLYPILEGILVMLPEKACLIKQSES